MQRGQEVKRCALMPSVRLLVLTELKYYPKFSLAAFQKRIALVDAAWTRSETLSLYALRQFVATIIAATIRDLWLVATKLRLKQPIEQTLSCPSEPYSVTYEVLF